MSEIDDVMNYDVLELTKNDEALLRLINKYREQRTQYKLGDKTAGKKEKVQLSLSDLGDIKI